MSSVSSLIPVVASAHLDTAVGQSHEALCSSRLSAFEQLPDELHGLVDSYLSPVDFISVTSASKRLYALRADVGNLKAQHAKFNLPNIESKDKEELFGVIIKRRQIEHQRTTIGASATWKEAPLPGIPTAVYTPDSQILYIPCTRFFRAHVLGQPPESDYFQKSLVADTDLAFSSKFCADRHAVVSLDGRYLAAETADNKAVLWDRRSSSSSGTVLTGESDRNFTQLFFSPKSDFLLRTQVNKGRFELLGLHPQPKAVPIPKHLARAQEPVFIGDSHLLMQSRQVGTAVIWDPMNSEKKQILAGGASSIIKMQASRDGNRVLIAYSDSSAKLWELSGECSYASVLEQFQADVTWASFSDDGRYLAARYLDRSGCIWKVGRKAHTEIYKRYEAESLHFCGFSPDSRYFQFSGYGGPAYIQKLTRSERALPYALSRNPEDRCTSVAFFPDSRFLATIVGMRETLIWNLTKNPATYISLGPRPHGIVRIVVSPDGRFLAEVCGRSIEISDLNPKPN